jgi:vacuolar protein sorting-associated protein 13A/C
MSKTALAFSFDDQFIQEKTKSERLNKATNMKDGLKKGFASAANSVSSGFSGLVKKPIEGARTGGLFGMIKGGAQGAAGLVTKTISGGIDIIAKTSEGMDYSSKTVV